MLLNTLSLENDKYEKADAGLEKLLIATDRNMAFSEDKISRGMKIFEERQNKLDFESAIQYQNDQIVSNIFCSFF